jgi:hypothetical protein
MDVQDSVPGDGIFNYMMFALPLIILTYYLAAMFLLHRCGSRDRPTA